MAAAQRAVCRRRLPAGRYLQVVQRVCLEHTEECLLALLEAELWVLWEGAVDVAGDYVIRLLLQLHGLCLRTARPFGNLQCPDSTSKFFYLSMAGNIMLCTWPMLICSRVL